MPHDAEESSLENDVTNEGLTKNIESNSAIRLKEHLEIISTDDARIKVIGEELANETGRAIFSRICQGSTSPANLAKSLNISLPLVNWHLNRLLGVGLIKIERIEMSSKNKGMKYYAPAKAVLMIIPPKDQPNSGSHGHIEKIIESLAQHLTGIICFIVGSVVIFLFGTNSGGIQLSDPAASSIKLALWQTALLCGATIGVSATIITRIAQKVKRKK